MDTQIPFLRVRFWFYPYNYFWTIQIFGARNIDLDQINTRLSVTAPEFQSHDVNMKDIA